MRSTEFSAGLAKLHGALSNLKQNWAETREEWDDEMSRRTDELHVQPLLQHVNRILEATVVVNDVMSNARRECEGQV